MGTLDERERAILVIDDDEVILRSIERQLRNVDVHLDLEHNPISGLARIAEKHYDLVLCDIKMKPINGIEVLRRIRASNPDLPVIILSAFVDDQLFEDARRLGSSDFLIKPVRRDALKSVIRSVLDRSNQA